MSSKVQFHLLMVLDGQCPKSGIARWAEVWWGLCVPWYGTEAMKAHLEL